MKNRRDLLLTSGAALLAGVSSPSAALAAQRRGTGRPRASSDHRGDVRALLAVTTPVPLGFPVLAFGKRVRDRERLDVAEFRFDWGDGTRGKCVDGLHGHVYERPGRYTVRLTIEVPGEEPLEAVEKVLVTRAERLEDPVPPLRALVAAAELLPVSARFRTALTCLGEEAAVDAGAAYAILSSEGDADAAGARAQACLAALDAAESVVDAAVARGEISPDQGFQFVSATLVPGLLGAAGLLTVVEREAQSRPHAAQLPEKFRAHCASIIGAYGTFLVQAILQQLRTGPLDPQGIVTQIGLLGVDGQIALFLLAALESTLPPNPTGPESAASLELQIYTFMERVC